MKFANIFKAQRIGDTQVESARITMELELPEFKNLEISAENFERDATILADVLSSTLPGGTLDRLLVELLKRKASLLIVPLFDK